MKLYNEEGQLIIDGEKDFTIVKRREGCISIEDSTMHLTICNFIYYMIPLGFVKKLKLLYEVIKYIFTKGENKP